ncbi:peptide chain release factor N(5)-glutamine methyltransferase [Candidatus Saccharibacteria bacterium]|nr:peptide chain release factor N(5)-glutamine methyltransferase [Candidatus Saccharibacteria bacterium]
MNVNMWLGEARKYVAAIDADLMMLTALGKEDRSELVLCAERVLTDEEADMLSKMMTLRRHDVPMAYLMGYKEFYGRKFGVDLTVLIPRPETEAIIEIVKKMDTRGKTIVDVGTGSGCIAITLALETEAEKVIGVDNSAVAIETAALNAKKLGAEVEFIESDVLEGVEEEADIIVANLPYVNPEWEWTSPEIDFEPAEALFAGEGGLEVIYRLIREVGERDLKRGTGERDLEHGVGGRGLRQGARGRDLILEADMSQHERIIAYAKKYGYVHAETVGLILVFRKK